uniref:Biogenesis of lysosome-related organelles complex 1 subunit 7 n=1 Tax=Heterorhabditis bacteriophora TaxID=37862 RepID=A0A1I7X0G4_HETBA
MKLYDMKQQMIHVPATTLMTAKDSKMIKPAGILSGFVTVTRTQPTLPGGPVYEESELPSNLVVELPISGIRKEPNLNMGNLKQRLKAFEFKKIKLRRNEKWELVLLSGMSGGSSPSETGGGSDMSDGIMSVVRPAIQQLDAQVQSTRNSQVILATRIRELSDLLHDMSQDQPYDLDVYSRKLDDTRRRLLNFGFINLLNTLLLKINEVCLLYIYINSSN